MYYILKFKPIRDVFDKALDGPVSFKPETRV